MNPKGVKQQFWQAMVMLFMVSFVVHLAGYWLAPFVPVLLVLVLLALIARLVFWRRRR